MIKTGEIDSCRDTIRQAKRGGQKVGLVPTMGALHEGHLSLIRAARRRCEFVAVTIFVNPTQFGPGEDIGAYPRTLDTDLGACIGEGVDLVFTPTVETMYPPQSQTTLHVDKITVDLCGKSRPTHFDGVATVVTKLFNILPADMAFFGEKDYQQLMVIRRMVQDLDIPIEIVPCPTVREADGLAMSSRNAYLSAQQRKQALSLSRALFAARDRVLQGGGSVGVLVSSIRELIEAAGPVEIDYVEVVDAETLEGMRTIDRPGRICVAARIGSCRLIDNVGV